jgi:hypothetical protein
MEIKSTQVQTLKEHQQLKHLLINQVLLLKVEMIGKRVSQRLNQKDQDIIHFIKEEDQLLRHSLEKTVW